MEGVEAEEFVHERYGLGVKFLRDGIGTQGLVEVFHDEVLRVGGTQAPEIDEEAVPGAFLLVTVFEGLEREEGGAPGESGDEVFVTAENVEGGTHVAAREKGFENCACVVIGGFAGKDGSCRFQKLGSS